MSGKESKIIYWLGILFTFLTSFTIFSVIDRFKCNSLKKKIMFCSLRIVSTCPGLLTILNFGSLQVSKFRIKTINGRIYYLN